MTAPGRRARPDLPAPSPVRARWFWAACGLLALVSLLPLWHHTYPGLPDYFNHLARAQIIVDEQLQGRAHPYYVLRHVLIPNLALDTLVPLAVHAGPETNDALRLFAGLALLLPVAGVIALGFVVQRATPWLALLAFPLAHSRYYAWGFLNYFFAVGLALLVFALWLHWRTTARPRRAALALAVLGATVLCAHLVGFGVLALMVLAVEAWHLLRPRAGATAPSWLARWREPLPALAALAACAALYLLLFERSLRLQVQWFFSIAGRLRNLASPFIAYEVVPGLVLMALLIGLLAWLARSRRLRLAPGWWAPVLPLMLSFALLPTAIMNSHYANSRLVVVAALVFVAHAVLRADRRAVVALVVVAASATLLRAAEADRHWAATARSASEIREALRALPPGAKLATVLYTERADRAALHPLRHVGAFAVIDRQAFMPNFFGFPFNGESVAFRPEVVPLVELVSKDALVFSPETPIPWSVYCAHYDAVLVIAPDRAGAAAAPPCAGATLGSGPGFRLQALRR